MYDVSTAFHVAALSSVREIQATVEFNSSDVAGYTNQLDTAVDMSGTTIGHTPMYAESRFNSSSGAPVSMAETNITGLIACGNGDTIRIRWNGDADTAYQQIKTYQSDYTETNVGYYNFYQIQNNASKFELINSDLANGVLDFKLVAVEAGTAYIAIVLYGPLDNVIVTKNEEIVEPTPGETFDGSSLISINVTEPVNDSSGINIGGTCSSTLTFNMLKPTEAVAMRGGNAVPKVKLVGADDIVPLGKFYIPYDGIVDNGKTISITAYDKMAMLVDNYIPSASLSFPCAPAALLADVCSQAGVNVPSATFPDMTIASAKEGTYRDQIGWLAGLCGCNARFNRAGNLVFVWYSTSGITIDRSHQYMGEMKKLSDQAFVINSLTTGSEDATIVVGNGKGISSPNPYMTQEAAQYVFDKIGGTSVYPLTVKWRCDPSLEAGDTVLVTDEQGINRTAFIMDHSISITGGMSDTIQSYDVQDAEFSLGSSPVDIKLKRQYNSLSSAFLDATKKIVGQMGGYFNITYDSDGFPTGWVIQDTPTVTDTTKMWIMNLGGLGFSRDGGKSISNVALTMDGAIDASSITVGNMTMERVTGLLSEFDVMSDRITAEVSTINGDIDEVRGGLASATTKITQLSDSVTIQASKVQALEGRQEKIDKTVTIDENGVTIAAGENAPTLNADNDAVSISSNGQERFRADTDGVTTPRLNANEIYFGSYGWVAWTDDDGNARFSLMRTK